MSDIYLVTVEYRGKDTVEVEADNKEEAKDKALTFAEINPDYADVHKIIVRKMK